MAEEQKQQPENASSEEVKEPVQPEGEASQVEPAEQPSVQAEEALEDSPKKTDQPGQLKEGVKKKSAEIQEKISKELKDIVEDVKDFSVEDVKNLDIHSSKGHHFLIIITCASLFVIILFFGVYSFLLKPSYGPNSVVVCKIDRAKPLPEACEKASKCKEFDRLESAKMGKYIQDGYVNCTPFKVKRE